MPAKTTAPPNTQPLYDVTRGKPYALVVLLQLHWFIRLRWLFAIMGLAALFVERLAFPQVHRPLELWCVLLAVVAVNVVWAVVSHLLRRQLEDPEGNQTRAIRSGQLFVSARSQSTCCC